MFVFSLGAFQKRCFTWTPRPMLSCHSSATAAEQRQPYTVRRNTAQGATLRPKLANRPDAPTSAGKS
ncbi:hypothetical protein FV194_31535 [Pseudomonas aeruginosa]|nr:hypothetical protein [Pseudomonas aeruginosa]